MKKIYIKNCSIKVLLIFLFYTTVIISQYKISSGVFSNGGEKHTGAIYTLNGTVGETLTGKSTTSIHQNSIGFWQVYWGIVAVEEDEMIPIEFKLHQNYPNPFNPSTIIKYAVPERSHVQIKLFNIVGEEVLTLANEEKDQGWYEIKLNSTNLASGIYIYRMQAGNYVSSKKMMLIR